MANNHVQPGKVLDYVNITGALIQSGDVVLAGALLGVSLVDIAPGATGSVAVDGVFAVPKKAGTAIAQGVELVYKAADKEFTVGAAVAGDVTGGSAVAFAAADAAATVVNVKFTGVPGAIKA